MKLPATSYWPVIMTLIVACNPDASTGRRAIGTPIVSKIPRNAVAIPSSPELRARAEKAAISRLLAIVTEEQRVIIKEAIVDVPKAFGDIQSVADNPEAAELIGRIYAIREAEYERRHLSQMQLAATMTSAPVTFALVERFINLGDAARVIRSPGSKGENIIAFKRASLTPERVSAAVFALSHSRLRHGEIPLRSVTVVLPEGQRLPRLSAEERTWTEGVIRRLRSAPPQNVRSIGNVPAITVSVGAAK